MKKLLLLIALSFAFYSCSSDDEPQGPGTEAEVEYKVESEEHLTVNEMADFIFGAPGSNADENIENKRNEFLAHCAHIEDSMANVTGQNAFTLIFGKATFTYSTKDENGNKIKLSAFMGYGEYWAFGYYPLDQDYYYFCCPYTHTLESECATADKGGYEFSLLMGDNLFVMPDGQGFGADKGHDQTYLNHELHAKQYADALIAGYNIYKDKIGGDFEDNWKLRIVGASQGAGDAIALHRLLDKNNNSFNIGGKTYKFPFEYSYVCCGPYNPEETMNTYYSWGGLTYPCVVPLVIKSMYKCYPDILGKYKESDFYSDLWNSNKTVFDILYLEKSKNTDDLNVYIRQKLKIGSEKIAPEEVPLTRILSSTVLDTNSQMYKDFMSCLKKQDLTSGWTPKTKCYIYYSKKDEVVPFVNTKRLIDFMGSKCSSEEAFWDSHVACCKQFMLKSW